MAAISWKSVRVEVIAGRESRVQMNDTVDVELGVNISVYDDRVFDESEKRMSGKIRQETPCECRHVAERAVNLKRVHDSEIGRDVPQPIYLEDGVKLLVQ